MCRGNAGCLIFLQALSPSLRHKTFRDPRKALPLRDARSMWFHRRPVGCEGRPEQSGGGIRGRYGNDPSVPWLPRPYPASTLPLPRRPRPMSYPLRLYSQKCCMPRSQVELSESAYAGCMPNWFVFCRGNDGRMMPRSG